MRCDPSKGNTGKCKTLAHYFADYLLPFLYIADMETRMILERHGSFVQEASVTSGIAISMRSTEARDSPILSLEPNVWAALAARGLTFRE